MHFFSEGPSEKWHAVEEGVKGKEAETTDKEVGLLWTHSGGQPCPSDGDMFTGFGITFTA